MNPNQTIRCASAIVVAAALGAGALTAAKAADIVQVMRHSTPVLPGYGTLMLEVWTDGTAVQVIGLDGEGQIVLAREGTLTEEATLEGTGAIEGRLPADQLDWVRGTEVAYQLCTTPDCARAIATRAESIVRASQMGVAQGADEGTIMAKLCPAPQAEEAHAHTPTEAIAAARRGEPVQVAAGRVRGPRADAGGGTAHARANRDDGPRAAPGEMGDPAGPALNRRGIETAPQAVARIRKGSAPLGRPSPGKLRALEARRAWTVPGRTTSMPPPTAAGNGIGAPPV